MLLGVTSDKLQVTVPVSKVKEIIMCDQGVILLLGVSEEKLSLYFIF